MVSGDGIRVDEEKVKAIQEWSIPQNMHEVQSFLGLATVYKWFLKNFNTLAAPITDCLKKGPFNWTEAATKSFEELKKTLTKTSVVALPDFEKIFQVDCDASHVGIGVVLSQEGRPNAYYSENATGLNSDIALMTLSFMQLSKL